MGSEKYPFMVVLLNPSSQAEIQKNRIPNGKTSIRLTARLDFK